MKLQNARNKFSVLHFVFLILISVYTPSVYASECFVVNPTILQVDQSSAKIVWVSSPESEAGTVYLQNANTGQKQQITAELSTPLFHKTEHEVLDYQRQIVQLESLEPFTDYSYHIECGKDNYADGSFKTAPISGISTPFEFAVISDAHADYGNFKTVAQAIGETTPSFVLSTGDHGGGSGADWDRWLPFFEDSRPYLKTSAFWPVIGNHDDRPARNFRAFFALNDPEGDPVLEDDASNWYTFTFGNAQFFVFDYQSKFLSSQLQWLEQELAKSNAQWKIVANHVSRFNVGGRAYRLDGIHREFATLYQDYEVDIVISGHDHIYERKLPVGPKNGHLVNYISINSGGGFREVRPSPIVIDGIGLKKHMYTYFKIDGNHLEMKARVPESSSQYTLIDYFELIKDGNGRYQEEFQAKSITLEKAMDIGYVFTGDDSDMRTRKDIYANFLNPLVKGDSINVIMDVSRFPEGSELIIYEQNDPAKWRVTEQVIEINDDKIVFNVIAPSNLTGTYNSLHPAFELIVNIRMDERDFFKTTIQPTIDKDLSLLLEPELISPRNGAQVPPQPTFQWSTVENAEKYQFQLTESTFQASNILLDTIVSEATLKYPFPLDYPDERYRWRVRALNHHHQPGPWAGHIMFSTVNPIEGPQPPEVVIDVDWDEFMRLDDFPAMPILTFDENPDLRPIDTIVDLEENPDFFVDLDTKALYATSDDDNVYFKIVLNPRADVRRIDSGSDLFRGDWYTGNTNMRMFISVDPDLEDGFRDNTGQSRSSWDNGYDYMLALYPLERVEHQIEYGVQASFREHSQLNNGWDWPAHPEELQHRGANIVWNEDYNEVVIAIPWEILETPVNLPDYEPDHTIAIMLYNDSYYPKAEGETSGRWTKGMLAGGDRGTGYIYSHSDANGDDTSITEVERPAEYSLSQNYPNPFNPVTTIRYELPEASHVVINVYDNLGQRVSTLVNERRQAGLHSTVFIGSSLTSGIYVYEMQVGSFSQTRKMMLIK